MERLYIHIFLPKGQANNTAARIAAHRVLFSMPQLQGYSEYHIFSDGGSKHFKNAASVVHLSLLAEELRMKHAMLTAHFFPSNHGSGPCDAVAHHAKAAAAKRELNSGKWVGVAVQDVDELASVVEELHHTITFALDMPDDLATNPVSTTWNGSRCEWHMLTFREGGLVDAWEHCDSDAPLQTRRITPNPLYTYI
jgi:hypothetical protein